jgi:hypothetical protein
MRSAELLSASASPTHVQLPIEGIQMSEITFYGYVLPKFANISLSFESDLRFDDAETGVVIAMKLSISESKIASKCNVSKFSQAILQKAYFRTIDMARAYVNVISFTVGEPLMVLVDEATIDGGVRNPVRFGTELAALSNSMKPEGRFQKACEAVISDSGFTLALADLLAALMNPHEAPINCARVIEGLRHLISPNLSQKQSWIQMRAALNVDEAYLKYITAHSENSRHGNRELIVGTIVAELLRRTWTIMDRFFEYRLGGRQPLSGDLFPLLKG